MQFQSTFYSLWRIVTAVRTHYHYIYERLVCVRQVLCLYVNTQQYLRVTKAFVIGKSNIRSANFS
jgi:hypothetical protein